MSQVIEVIGADQGVESFTYGWIVVLGDKILSITILVGYFFVTKSGVNLVSPIS